MKKSLTLMHQFIFRTRHRLGKLMRFLVLLMSPFFSIKMMEGIIATSYSAGDKFYIDPAKLLPLARFLPQPKGAQQAFRGGGRGGGRGGRGGGGGFRGARGGGGGFRGGRGPPRGGRGGGFRGRGRF
ncbi:hypothetical protein AABB24_018032 [Solanum stoloniferum]|uniref:Uncharacterized protein n=1 Tax=Solanum stoloniferum TaxID=62892 RepID=A0ABD2TMQ7_9SOLN